MISQVCTYLGMVLLTLGSLLTLIAAIGVVRFPSLLQRQHAATKPQLLGFMLSCLGVALIQQTLAWSSAVCLAILLQTLTAPIGAHLVGRTARQSGEIRDLTKPVAYHYFDQLPHPYDQNLRIKPDAKSYPEPMSHAED